MFRPSIYLVYIVLTKGTPSIECEYDEAMYAPVIPSRCWVHPVGRKVRRKPVNEHTRFPNPGKCDRIGARENRRRRGSVCDENAKRKH